MREQWESWAAEPKPGKWDTVQAFDWMVEQDRHLSNYGYKVLGRLVRNTWYQKDKGRLYRQGWVTDSRSWNWTHQGFLAEHMNTTDRSVRRGMDELTEKGYIERQHRRTPKWGEQNTSESDRIRVLMGDPIYDRLREEIRRGQATADDRALIEEIAEKVRASLPPEMPRAGEEGTGQFRPVPMQRTGQPRPVASEGIGQPRPDVFEGNYKNEGKNEIEGGATPPGSADEIGADPADSSPLGSSTAPAPLGPAADSANGASVVRDIRSAPSTRRPGRRPTGTTAHDQFVTDLLADMVVRFGPLADNDPPRVREGVENLRRSGQEDEDIRTAWESFASTREAHQDQGKGKHPGFTFFAWGRYQKKTAGDVNAKWERPSSGRRKPNPGDVNSRWGV